MAPYRRSLLGTFRDPRVLGIAATRRQGRHARGSSGDDGDEAGHPGKGAVGRTVPIGASFVAAALVASGCSSSGTHTQTPGPTTPTTDSSTAPASTPASTATSRPPTHTPTKPLPTPTVTPPAQAAVNAYIGLDNISWTLGLDPAHADTSKLAPYVTSSTLPQWRQVFMNMAKQHLAYRGTPDTPNIKVVAASSTSAALTSCPTPSLTNPAVQYNILTGKVVSSSSAGPYLKAITVIFTEGRWRVSGIATNTAKKCSP